MCTEAVEIANSIVGNPPVRLFRLSENGWQPVVQRSGLYRSIPLQEAICLCHDLPSVYVFAEAIAPLPAAEPVTHIKVLDCWQRHDDLLAIVIRLCHRYPDWDSFSL